MFDKHNTITAYAFIILEGYINMALIKDCIYLFDSHSRNVCGTLVHA